ncbi:MAG: aldehyde dehydrogenase family protein [Candidatus Aminicenantales bacterium]
MSSGGKGGGKVEDVLLAGRWQSAHYKEVFQPWNPARGEKIAKYYPVSTWDDIEIALEEGWRTIIPLMKSRGREKANFFSKLADLLEERREDVLAMAHLETGLPVEPRLNSNEFPRMINQLRQAAVACEEGSWCQATIDTRLNIRSKYEPLGGVVIIFSPNNFPLAFNSVGGGDFISALAVGNPVICKANPSHPGTTKLIASAAKEALEASGLPVAAVQMLYHFGDDDGLRLVSHPYVAAIAFTGSRQAGLKIKEVAEKAGKIVSCELSSVNPVFFLPGIIKEKLEMLASELFASCTLGEGQFCTKPGLAVFLQEPGGEEFLSHLRSVFSTEPAGYLLSPQVQKRLEAQIIELQQSGAELLCGGHALPGPGFRFAPTLFKVEGKRFLARPEAFQTEIFGPLTVAVMVENVSQMINVAWTLKGSLAISIFASAAQEDEQLYFLLEPALRLKAGRLLNDKMPTGVAVTPAMHHGGPFPATGHPGFTAVGIPFSFLRFAARRCYDNIPESRLPEELRKKNPNSRMWRYIDGQWSQADF